MISVVSSYNQIKKKDKILSLILQISTKMDNREKVENLCPDAVWKHLWKHYFDAVWKYLRPKLQFSLFDHYVKIANVFLFVQT